MSFRHAAVLFVKPEVPVDTIARNVRAHVSVTENRDPIEYKRRASTRSSCRLSDVERDRNADLVPHGAAPVASGLELPMLHSTVDRLKPTSTSHHTSPSQPTSSLPPSQHVFIRRNGHCTPLSPAYDGPFKVVKQTDKVVTIERGSTTDTISVDRCKPAILEVGTEMEQLRPRGRPPGRIPPSTKQNASQTVPTTSMPTALLPAASQPLPTLRQSQRLAHGIPPPRYGINAAWGEAM